MKTRRLCCILLVVLTLISSSDMMAQKRKARSGSKARTTASARKSATAVTGPDLNREELVNRKYFGFWSMSGTGKQYKDIWCDMSLLLEPDNITWKTAESTLGGSWSVTGNKLNVISGGLTLKMTSSDGGSTFVGKFGNGKGLIADCLLYKTTLSGTPLDIAAFKKKLLNGKFKAFMDLEVSGTGLGVPVTVRFTPDTNSDEGKFKVICTHEKMGTVFGKIKGSYKFTDKGLILSSSTGKNIESSYEEMNSNVIKFDFGRKSIPGIGDGYAVMCLFFK